MQMRPRKSGAPSCGCRHRSFTRTKRARAPGRTTAPSPPGSGRDQEPRTLPDLKPSGRWGREPCGACVLRTLSHTRTLHCQACGPEAFAHFRTLRTLRCLRARAGQVEGHRRRRDGGRKRPQAAPRLVLNQVADKRWNPYRARVVIATGWGWRRARGDPHRLGVRLRCRSECPRRPRPCTLGTFRRRRSLSSRYR